MGRSNGGLVMEHSRFGNSDLMVSIIGLGCYGMSGAYGPADDAESITTIRRALELGVNFLDTSASYGQGHNHHLIGEAIRRRRHDVVIHSKSGSPRDGSPNAVRGGGDPRYLRQTCEQSLKNLGIETLDVFCMSRVDPNVPVEESVGGMADLVKEGKPGARRRRQAFRKADRQQSRALAECHRQGRRPGTMAGRFAGAGLPAMKSFPLIVRRLLRSVRTTELLQMHTRKTRDYAHTATTC